VDDRITLATTPEAFAVAGRLLDEFNTAYDDPSPGPGTLAARLAHLVGAGSTDVLVAQESGVCVLRYRPALWSDADEAYLAELWVDPGARRLGLGRALLRAGLERARERGCEYLELATTEDDVEARRLYESEGLHATEGIDGPTAYHYEIDL
jgi:ribosomal protein S18 acetylase RimI-like enzyme